jgi:hypothetical protein
VDTSAWSLDMIARLIRRSLAAACVLAASGALAAAQEDMVTADPTQPGRGVVAAARTMAEVVEEARRSPEWGTGALAVINIPAWTFAGGVQRPDATGDSTSYNWSTSGNNSIFGIFRTHGAAGGQNHAQFAAGLDSVPAGAQITGIVLEGCDTSATHETMARLVILPSGGSWSSSPELQTGLTQTPGCAVFGSATNLVASNIIVDKLANTYLVNVVLRASDNTTQFRSVRVFYRLRVSPGPAAATFADVPTSHPFFQFVEALAASGITGGCGGGNFCPDSPLTRGQMSVFLATALGLHFPN